MAIRSDRVRVYLKERYPFYVAYQLDASVALLEDVVKDYRDFVKGGSCEELIHIVTQNANKEKRDVYVKLIKTIWLQSAK